MITDETSEKHSTGAVAGGIRLETDRNLAIGVEQVGSDRISAEIHPRTDHAVSQISVMNLVAPTLEQRAPTSPPTRQ